MSERWTFKFKRKYVPISQLEFLHFLMSYNLKLKFSMNYKSISLFVLMKLKNKNKIFTIFIYINNHYKIR